MSIDETCVYLGAPEPCWIGRTNVPLCVSFGRLRRIKHKLPKSPEVTWVVDQDGQQTLQRGGSWFLDSRGFNELREFGRWTIPPLEYVAALARYDEQIGNLTWAAAQDSMCEPDIIYGGRHGGQTFAGTRQFIDPNGKLSFDQLVEIHLQLTVENFLTCKELWPQFSDADNPFMPTLQGWFEKHYHRCWDLYEAAGVRISEHYPVVALGSVCTRQDTAEIARIFHSLRARDRELPLHGFGVKQAGLRLPWSSVDSQAWSFDARYGNKRHPDCTAAHQNCASCLTYALSWHADLLTKVTRPDSPIGLFELEEAA